MSCYKYEFCKYRNYTDAILELTKDRWFSVTQLKKDLELKKDIRLCIATLTQILNDMHEMGFLACKKGTRREGKRGTVPHIYRNAGEVMSRAKKV